MALPLVFQPLCKETHSTRHSINRFVFPPPVDKETLALSTHLCGRLRKRRIGRRRYGTGTESARMISSVRSKSTSGDPCGASSATDSPH